MMSLDWELCKSAREFVIEDIWCPECGEQLCFEQKETNGRIMYRAFCPKCRYYSNMLPQRKNELRRNNAGVNNWAEKVKKRDFYTCRVCGSTKNVEAHHIIPVSHGGMRYLESNGLTLCEKCHKMAHGKETRNE